MKGLLLAGGHGTRLRPLTFTGNKHMIPIANKPMLFYGLEHLLKAGIKEIAIVLGPIQEGIREKIGNGKEFDGNVTYIQQPDPRGLAHTVQLSEDFMGDEPFVMYLGDNLMMMMMIIRQGVIPLMRTFVNDKSDSVICISSVGNASQYGVVEMNFSGNITRLVEKPSSSISNLALVGVYLFNHHIFEAVREIKPSWRNELEITDAIQYLLQTHRRISVEKVSGWWKDTGRPSDLLDANHLVLDDLTPKIDIDLPPSCQLTGKVSISHGTTLSSNTRIRGPAIVGRNCEIGPNVYIGPYTSIGDNSKVLSGELEGSIMMENVIIICKKRLVDSTKFDY